MSESLQSARLATRPRRLLRLEDNNGYVKNLPFIKRRKKRREDHRIIS